MNIKITKEENEALKKHFLEMQIFGSHLFGVETEDSDEDYLCLYNPSSENWIALNAYPSQHQFQYDDVENNKQYIWTTPVQFWKNLNSGDSTINADVILFGNLPIPEEFNIIEVLRTYKIIKAYLGVAARDLKNHKVKGKLFHAERSIYCARSLMNGVLPTIDVIQNIKINPRTVTELKDEVTNLRSLVNDMYNNDVLKNYFIPRVEDPLLQTLLDSNNIKEFRYS